MTDPIRFPGPPAAHDAADPPAALTDRELRVWLQHLTESQAALVSELHLMTRQQPDALRAAVVAGIQAALTNHDTIGKVLEAAVDVGQERAARNSGRWLLGTAWRLTRAWVVIGLVMVMTLKVAGPEAAAKLGAWMAKLAS